MHPLIKLQDHYFQPEDIVKIRDDGETVNVWFRHIGNGLVVTGKSRIAFLRFLNSVPMSIHIDVDKKYRESYQIYLSNGGDLLPGEYIELWEEYASLVQSKFKGTDEQHDSRVEQIKQILLLS